MIVKTLQFEIHEKKSQEVIEAIEQLTHTVHVSEPGCRLYISIRDSQDQNKFIHIMAFENEGAEMKHRSAAYSESFMDLLHRTCKKKPAYRDYAYIGGL